MALLFMDGFDVGDVAVKYSAIGAAASYAATTRFSSGQALKIQSGGGGERTLSKVQTASAKIFLGFAYYRTSLTYGQQMLSLLGDSGTTTHLTLNAQTNGTLTLSCGATTLATSSPVITASTWRYVEISATISATVGNVVVKIDGTQVITFTGNTKNGGTNNTIDSFAFFNDGAGNNAIYLYDDLYLCNDTGTVNNTFLGDVRVQTLAPSGAGSSTQFIPTGSANNWDNVNDVPYVSSTYNADSVSGHRDIYVMDDLNGATGTVFGVQSNFVALKSDAGTSIIKAAIKSGATVYYDSPVSLGASISCSSVVREVSPATSAAWTPAGVNALEFGAEVV